MILFTSKAILFVVSSLSVFYVLWCDRRYDVIDEKDNKTGNDIKMMIKLSKRCDIFILIFVLSLGLLFTLGIIEFLVWLF